MATRDLEKAREAYDERDVEKSKIAHNHHTNPELHKTFGEYLKSAVFGGLDGILTIFAIVTGGFGGGIQASSILILGISSLIADAIAMAVGDYMGTKSEIEFEANEREREEWEVENHPEDEKVEMEEIYVSKGVAAEDAKLIVDIFAKNRKTWVDIMMAEELGLMNSDESPLKNALVTFFSFNVFGIIPLIPYFFNTGDQNKVFYMSIGLTGFSLLTLGMVKTKFTGGKIILSGIETFLIGSFAAGVAYVIGLLLSPYMPQSNN